MSRHGVTDVHLHSLKTSCEAVGGDLFLQTSPEYAMKRLLAAGSGDVFQICRAFRNAERGRHHNPEFTMLEWYRVGFDHHLLMDEVGELLTLLLSQVRAGASPDEPALLQASPERCRYRDLFRQELGVDPLTASDSALEALAGADAHVADGHRDDLLALLLTRDIEPSLPSGRLVFVHDYPPSQAALARTAIDQEGDSVASRFEVYLNGSELANGFHELENSEEQAARFAKDNRARGIRGLESIEPDTRLLAALEAGFPDCAGVAVGLDRVIMLAARAESLDEVIAFPIERS